LIAGGDAAIYLLICQGVSQDEGPLPRPCLREAQGQFSLAAHSSKHRGDLVRSLNVKDFISFLTLPQSQMLVGASTQGKELI
jgi:hypothetical protein